MNNTSYYQKNTEIMLNRNLSKEDKKKKREYGKNRYHGMSEEKKQELK